MPSPDRHRRAALLPGPDTSPLRHTSRHHGQRIPAVGAIDYGVSRLSTFTRIIALVAAPAATARKGRPRVGQSLPALDTACGEHHTVSAITVRSFRCRSVPKKTSTLSFGWACRALLYRADRRFVGRVVRMSSTEALHSPEGNQFFEVGD